jgi:NDP-sugar pyrophosphorylase family protein
MKAMILAAGKGTRLGKLTKDTPKALVDVNGKSILRIAVEKCTASGFNDIIINVHHFADMVEKEADYLKSIGFRITLSDEREMLLETGGGLFKARNFFDSTPFLLYNTDIVTDMDLSTMLKYHSENGGLATLAVRNRAGRRFFLVNSEGLLCGWKNKETGEKIITSHDKGELLEIAFSGIHIINPEIFDYMTEGAYTMTSLYLQLASSHKICTFRYDSGYWGDIGTPENLENIRNFLKSENH